MPIFDQGYQHWSGALAGHGWRWVTITRHGVRSGLKNRVIRTFLLLSWGPALGLVFTLCVWGLIERKSDLVSSLTTLLRFIQPEILANPRLYRKEIWTICFDWFLQVELWFSMFLIVLVGPNLISQDLRFNALPMYFSRPLRRVDYFAGKLGVIAAFLGMMIVVPAVVAYVLGLAFSLDLTIVRDTLGLFLSVVGFGLMVAVSAGLLVLALSSLSRNSRYVVLMWLGIWVVSTGIWGMLEGVDQDHRRREIFQRVLNTRDRARTTTGPITGAEQRRIQREWNEAFQRARAEFETAQMRAEARNWRPVVSYVANLSRVGRQLLGTNAKWESLSRLRPAEERERFLYDYMGPRYPWYWSASVLVVLLGLSVCILNFRVKSLDRLK